VGRCAFCPFGLSSPKTVKNIARLAHQPKRTRAANRGRPAAEVASSLVVLPGKPCRPKTGAEAEMLLKIKSLAPYMHRDDERKMRASLLAAPRKSLETLREHCPKLASQE